MMTNNHNDMMNLDGNVVDNTTNNNTNDNNTNHHHPNEENLIISQEEEENLNIQQEQQQEQQHDEKEAAADKEQQKQKHINIQQEQQQVQHHDEKEVEEDNEQNQQHQQQDQSMKKYKKATKYDNKHYKFPKDLLLFLNTVSNMKQYNNDKVVEWSISDHYNHNNNTECYDDDEYRNNERCTVGESEENNNNDNKNNNNMTNTISNHNKNRSLLYSSFLINRNHIDLPHLLEQFFGHNNFDSLRRQLNMYAFRLHKSGRFERAKGSYPFHRDMTSNDLICIKPRPNISRNIRDQEKRSTKIYKYNSKHNQHDKSSTSKKNNNVVEVVETKRKYNKKQKIHEKIDKFSVNNEIKKNNNGNVEEMDEDNEEHQSDDDDNDDDDDQSSIYDSSLSTYVTLGPLDTETIKELEKFKTNNMMDDVVVDDYEVLFDTSVDNQKEEGLEVTLDEDNIYHQQDLIDNENNEDNNKEPIPEAKFKVYQKVYAADKDGLLYEAVIRRCLYGPQYQKQVQMGCITSTIEADKILEKWNHEPKESIWHYFVHYNKWSVNFDRWIPENYVYDILELQVKEFATRLMKESRLLQSEMKRKKTKTINGTLYLEEWKKRSIQLANEMKFQYRYNHILWYDADDPGRLSIAADTTTTKVDNSMDDIVEDDEDTVKDHRSKKSKKGTKSASTASSSSIWTKASLILEKKYRDKGLTSKRCNVNTNTDIHQIIIPFVLKKIMVESWEIICHCQMISNIPCSITIRQALHMYLKSKNVIMITTNSDTEAVILKEGDDDIGNDNQKEVEVATSPPTDDTTSITPPPTDDTTSMIIDDNKAVVVDDDIIKKKERDQEWIDMIDGIIMLFDEALPYHLLYREEMLQLQTLDDSIEYNMKSYSDIYGCEHLLRLFVRLPNMFNDILDSSKNNNNNNDSNDSNGIIDQMKQIYGKVNDLLRFLHKNYNTIFIQTHRKLNEMEIKEQQKRMIRMNGGNANSSTTTTTAVEKSSSSSKKRKKN